ncbi:MAG: hypothetical protein AAF788_05430 [Pseudomonadota bacterium]
MHDEFEVLCLQMQDPTTLVGQAFATDKDMQCQCERFLHKEDYDSQDDDQDARIN